MTITLPIADLEYPLVRIMVMRQGHWTDGEQPWEILPATARFNSSGNRYYGRKHGYDLDMVETASLPDVGAAVFHFDYGEINNVNYTETTGAAITNARDLIGYDVRIQLAPAPSAEDIESNTAPTIAWKTVFLGTIVAQDEDPFLGSSAAGRRTYRCADLLFRTTRWVMNRHNAASVDFNGGNTTTYVHAISHPGYNYAVQGYYRRIIGNKFLGSFTPTDVWGDNPTNLANYLAHTWTGTGNSLAWNDLEVINHALVSSRLKGEPCLSIVASSVLEKELYALSQAKFSWSVAEGETCWDFMNRILDRRRGRGLAKLYWDELNINGNINPGIYIYPQFYNDAGITSGDGQTINFYGAHTVGTDVAVDLVGDHRVPEHGVSISQNVTATVDYLESFGEPIEILVTLSPGDEVIDGSRTLEKRWGASEEADFAAIDRSTASGRAQASTDRWRPIWQRWSLPQNWLFNVSDGSGDGSVSSPVNWFCKDDGTLSVYDFATASDTTKVGVPSPLTARIMCDLPLYEGYDYTSNSYTRYDGATDQLCPPRLPPMILVRDTSDPELFYDATKVGVGIANDDWGVMIINGNDNGIGMRFFGDPTDADVCSGPGFEQMVITVGLQLSARVRIASFNNDPDSVPYNAVTAPRKKALYFPGVFLWLADPNAIWQFQNLISTNPLLPITRDAAPASDNVIRDDRYMLASLHALAWAWYSVIHRTGHWTLRDCGLLTSFQDSVLGTVLYPTVGGLVTTIAASGTTYTMNAPITKITYNHRDGTTMWVVDWNDLDMSRS